MSASGISIGANGSGTISTGGISIGGNTIGGNGIGSNGIGGNGIGGNGIGATGIGANGIGGATASASSSSITAALLSFEEKLRKHGPFLLHLGNTCALAGFAMSDVLHLRALNLFAAWCGFIFNITHVPRLKRGAAWNVVFFLVNGFMTVVLIMERHQEITFSREQLEIFTKHFLPYGVSPLHAKKVMELATWVDMPAGTVIAREGETSSQILLVVDGHVEALVAHGVAISSFSMDNIGSRGVLAAWVGEPSFLDSRQAKGHLATYVAKTPVRILVWDNDKLKELLSKDDDMEREVHSVVAGSLVSKVLRFAEETTKQALDAYTHILGAVVADSIIDPAEKRVVREYREKYNITDEAHRDALARLGWSLQDFEDGSKPQPSEIMAATTKVSAALARHATLREHRDLHLDVHREGGPEPLV